MGNPARAVDWRRLFYVEAHAGLGKSRLLAAAAQGAREAGIRVYVAT